MDDAESKQIRTILLHALFPLSDTGYDADVSGPRVRGPLGQDFYLSVDGSSTHDGANLNVKVCTPSGGLDYEAKFVVVVTSASCAPRCALARAVHGRHFGDLHVVLSAIEVAQFRDTSGSLLVLCYVNFTHVEHLFLVSDPAARTLPHRLLRDGGWGVLGLRNLGATCFLNSLLQALFHVPLLRRLVFDFPVAVEDAPPAARFGGGVVDLCGAEENADGGAPAPPPLPLPASTPLTPALLAALSRGEARVAPHSAILHAFQRVFFELCRAGAEGSRGAVDPERLTRAFGWTSSDTWEQQDAMEMFVQLVRRLTEELGGEGAPLGGALQALFSFDTATRTQAPGQPEKDHGLDRQLFLNVALAEEEEEEEGVAEVRADADGAGGAAGRHPVLAAPPAPGAPSASLVSLLRRRYCVPKRVRDYEVPGGARVTATQTETFRTLPPVLFLSLLRFNYSRREKKRVKLPAPVEFPEVLDMADFLEPAAEERSPRGGGGGGGSKGEGGAAAARGGGGSGGDPVVCAAVRAATAAVREGLAAARPPVGGGRARAPMRYHLAAVLTHRGTGAGGGHYFAFVRPGLGPGGEAPGGDVPSSAAGGAAVPSAAREPGFQWDPARGEAPFRVPASLRSWPRGSFFDDRVDYMPSEEEHAAAMRREGGGGGGGGGDGYSVAAHLHPDRAGWGGWFKLDDTRVEPVTREEAVEANWGTGRASSSSAYALVYLAESALHCMALAPLPRGSGGGGGGAAATAPAGRARGAAKEHAALLAALAKGCVAASAKWSPPPANGGGGGGGGGAKGDDDVVDVEEDDVTEVASMGEYCVDVGSTLVPAPVHERVRAERAAELAEERAEEERERASRKARLLLLHCVTDLHVAADPLPLSHAMPCPLESARLGGAIAAPVRLGDPVDAAYCAVGAALGLPKSSFRLFVMRQTGREKGGANSPMRPAEQLPFSRDCEWVSVQEPEDGEVEDTLAPRYAPYLPPFLEDVQDMPLARKHLDEAPGRGWFSGPLPTVDDFFSARGYALAAELPRAESPDTASVAGAKSCAEALRALPPRVAVLAEHFGGFDAWDAWAAGAASAQVPPPPRIDDLTAAAPRASWSAPTFKVADVHAHAAVFVQLLPHAELVPALAAAAALQPLPNAPAARAPPAGAEALAASLHPTLRLLAPLAHITLHNTAIAAGVALGDLSRSAVLTPAQPGYVQLLAESLALADDRTQPAAAHLRPDLALPSSLHARLTYDLLPLRDKSQLHIFTRARELAAVMVFRFLRSPKEAAEVAEPLAPAAQRPFFSGPYGYVGMLFASRTSTMAELLLSLGRFVGLAPPVGWEAPPAVRAAAQAEDRCAAPEGWPSKLEAEDRRTLDGLSAAQGMDRVTDRWLLKQLRPRLQLFVWGMEPTDLPSFNTLQPTPILPHMLPWQLFGNKNFRRTEKERNEKGKQWMSTHFHPGASLWAAFSEEDVGWWLRETDTRRWLTRLETPLSENDAAKRARAYPGSDATGGGGGGGGSISPAAGHRLLGRAAAAKRVLVETGLPRGLPESTLAPKFSPRKTCGLAVTVRVRGWRPEAKWKFIQSVVATAYAAMWGSSGGGGGGGGGGSRSGDAEPTSFYCRIAAEFEEPHPPFLVRQDECFADGDWLRTVGAAVASLAAAEAQQCVAALATCSEERSTSGGGGGGKSSRKRSRSPRLDAFYETGLDAAVQLAIESETAQDRVLAKLTGADDEEGGDPGATLQCLPFLLDLRLVVPNDGSVATLRDAARRELARRLCITAHTIAARALQSAAAALSAASPAAALLQQAADVLVAGAWRAPRSSAGLVLDSRWLLLLAPAPSRRSFLPLVDGASSEEGGDRKPLSALLSKTQGAFGDPFERLPVRGSPLAHWAPRSALLQVLQPELGVAHAAAPAAQVTLALRWAGLDAFAGTDVPRTAAPAASFVLRGGPEESLSIAISRALPALGFAPPPPLLEPADDEGTQPDDAPPPPLERFRVTLYRTIYRDAPPPTVTVPPPAAQRPISTFFTSKKSGGAAAPPPPPPPPPPQKPRGEPHPATVSAVSVLPLSVTLGAVAALAGALAPYGAAAELSPSPGGGAAFRAAAAFHVDAMPTPLAGLSVQGAPEAAAVPEALRGAWVGITLLLELVPAWEPSFPACVPTPAASGGVAAALARARGAPPPPPPHPPRPFRFVAVAPCALPPDEDPPPPAAPAGGGGLFVWARSASPPPAPPPPPPPALLGRMVLVPVQPHTTLEDVRAYAAARLGVPSRCRLLAADMGGPLGLGALPLEELLSADFWAPAPPPQPPPRAEADEDIIEIVDSDDEAVPLSALTAASMRLTQREPPPPGSAEAPSAALLGALSAGVAPGALQLLLGRGLRGGGGPLAALQLPLLAAPCPAHVVAAAGRAATGAEAASGMEEGGDEEEGGEEGGGARAWCPLHALTGGAQLVLLPAGSWPPGPNNVAGRAAGLVPVAAAVPALLQSIRALHHAQARAAASKGEEDDEFEEDAQGAVTVKGATARGEQGIKL